MMFFFFKQKTAYELRISDWSSDVCSSDLSLEAGMTVDISSHDRARERLDKAFGIGVKDAHAILRVNAEAKRIYDCAVQALVGQEEELVRWLTFQINHGRSEEHTSELQSLMRISYAVFCLKKKKTQN